MIEIFHTFLEALAFLLHWFYGLVSSFGVGIVLLTIAINLVLFPLTLKQTRATRAFQTIQPEIKRIQKELKDQPEEMQKELMRVQREAGASPGGCLIPLLVQAPVFLALFRVLSQIEVTEDLLPRMARFLPQVSVGDMVPRILELLPTGSRLGEAIANGNTGFLGMQLSVSPGQAFATGVAAALPYLMMIVIMVASQYVQTWHATYGQDKPTGPQAGAQQVMTKVMPLFIGFVSWNFPAGLVLYWATANLFRLGQQVLIFRIDGRPTSAGRNEDVAPSAPAAEEPPPKKAQPSSKKKQNRRRRS